MRMETNKNKGNRNNKRNKNRRNNLIKINLKKSVPRQKN